MIIDIQEIIHEIIKVNITDYNMNSYLNFDYILIHDNKYKCKYEHYSDSTHHIANFEFIENQLYLSKKKKGIILINNNKNWIVISPLQTDNGSIYGYFTAGIKNSELNKESIIGITQLIINLINEKIKNETLTQLKSDYYDTSLFTEMENKIIKLLIEGNTDQHISKMLHISISTERKHVNNIFKKQNVKSRAEFISNIYRSNTEDDLIIDKIVI